MGVPVHAAGARALALAAAVRAGRGVCGSARPDHESHNWPPARPGWKHPGSVSLAALRAGTHEDPGMAVLRPVLHGAITLLMAGGLGTPGCAGEPQASFA